MERAERTLFARGIADATASASGAALDLALSDLGWLDAFDDDPHSAVSILFEAQGSAAVTSGALERLMLRALGLADEPALGGTPVVILPALREVDVPGSPSGEHCIVDGLALGDLSSGPTAVVVCANGRGHDGFAVPMGSLTLRQVGGLDPRLGLVEATGDVETSDMTPLGPLRWEHALALGQLALGHELVGTARAMVELARVHALDRGAVRAPDQRVPGRPAPPRRCAGFHRSGRCAPRRGLGGPCGARGDGQGLRRAAGSRGGPPRPTGAGRHRLHHRAPVPPPGAAHARPRPVVRRRHRLDPAPRRGGSSNQRRCRRPSRSEGPGVDTAGEGPAGSGRQLSIMLLTLFDNAVSAGREPGREGQ